MKLNSNGLYPTLQEKRKRIGEITTRHKQGILLGTFTRKLLREWHTQKDLNWALIFKELNQDPGGRITRRQNPHFISNPSDNESYKVKVSQSHKTGRAGQLFLIKIGWIHSRVLFTTVELWKRVWIFSSSGLLAPILPSTNESLTNYVFIISRPINSLYLSLPSGECPS